MNPGFYIGVDPGITGAICVLTAAGEIVELVDMPIIDGRVQARSLPIASTSAPVAIEQVSTRPGLSATAVLKTGLNAGILHGFYSDHRILEPRPQQWGTVAGIPRGLKGKARKDRSRLLAAQRWPQHADKFARKKDDGRADACWVAQYLRQTILQENGTAA